MSYFQSTYPSKIYREFRDIDESAYRQRVRFFEENEKKIRQLEFMEYFDLLVDYVNALFEIGSYHRHLVVVDDVVELSIERNIKIHRGVDIFQQMLFRKASSLYQNMEYDQAVYILRELIKMDAENKDAAPFLKKCLRKRQSAMVRNARAASIFLFLMTALVICVEVLLVRPFYSIYVNIIETSRISIFALGCFILIGADLLHRGKVEKEVNTFVSKSKEQKKAVGSPIS